MQSVKAHLRGMSLTYCDVLKGSPLFLCIFFGYDGRIYLLMSHNMSAVIHDI